MKFAVYYADGHVHTGDTRNIDDVASAPSWDVITVKHAAENELGWSLRHGCALYGWMKLKRSDGSWTSGEYYWSALGDQWGLANYLRATEHEMQKILIGREIHDTTFCDIIEKAKNDGLI